MKKNNFSIFLSIISFFFLFYVIYKAEFYWGGSLSNHYKPYYYTSILLILFSIVTFFLNQKIKTYLLIIISSSFFSLYAYEIFLTFKETKFLNKKKIIFNENSNKTFDTRDTFEVFFDLNKNQSNITYFYRPPINYNQKIKSDFVPLSGRANSKTIHCNENGYFSIYESDRYGFNNPDKEWENNEIEYLLLGDSFTHGACVNRPNDISSNLRLLSNKSVLSLGIQDNGPLSEFASLKEYYKKNTKKIIWMFFEGNDIEDLALELNNNILKKYLLNKDFNQDLINRQNEIDSLTFKYNPKKKESVIINNTFLNTIKLTKTRYKIKVLKKMQKDKTFDQKQDINLIYSKFRTILEETKNFSTNNNSTLYFVYIPYIHKNEKKLNFNNYKKVKKLVINLDIPFIDLNTELFEKKDDPLSLHPFKDVRSHFTPKAYKEIAEIIFRKTNN